MSASQTSAAEFKISLAEWSLHRAIEAGRISHDDFPRLAREEFGIDAIELVNSLFKERAKDGKYLADFKRRSDDLGVRILLIMCDHEGLVGDPNAKARAQTVENHLKWMEAAKRLGCHSIRVNAYSEGTAGEQLKLVADGLRRLCRAAEPFGLNVVVENHGGHSSDGGWMTSLMKEVTLPNCGTLPDFGNFRIAEGVEYDRYRGVAEMMPYAKAVSAKCRDFDENGNETTIDYHRMLDIVVRQFGYKGYLGIEYGGKRPDEFEGVRRAKRLLERVRMEFAAPIGGN